MINRKAEKVYYEAELVEKVTCDKCNKDITNEEFFSLEVAFREVSHDKKFTDKVYETNNGYSVICKDCITGISNTLPNCMVDYINDSVE
jgi:hypothetical protein